MLTIAREPVDSADARVLIAEMHTLMQSLYPGESFGALTPEQVAPPQGLFVVARLDGDPVGCGAIRQMTPDVGEIKRMYVRGMARGQGVATKILHMLEQHARRSGYRQIWLETGIHQPAAIHLYEREGYTRMDCYGVFSEDLSSVCYRKTL